MKKTNKNEKAKKLTECISGNLLLGKYLLDAILLMIAGKEQINVLIIGEQFTGKTTLLKNISKLVSNASYANAIIPKNILSRNQILLLDNIEQMKDDDKLSLASIINKGFKVLATTNCKYQRYDPFSSPLKQVNLPALLLNKFDLVMILKDLPDKKQDELKVNRLFNKNNINNDYFLKTLQSIKKINPIMTAEAKKEIENYYISMRHSSESKSIPITLKQVETLIKLSKANASLDLSKKVTNEHAKKAIDLLHYCLRMTAFDHEDNIFDIHKAMPEISSKEKNSVSIIKEIINHLEYKAGQAISLHDIKKIAIEKGMKENDMENAIEILKEMGDIFHPREGHIQKA